MDKDYWWFPALTFILVAVSAVIGIMFGARAGVEQALVRVCNQTNGRYDFCQEVTVKKYKIAIPDPCMEKGLKNELTEEEWQNCFGTPIFKMKGNK